jgi:hypothetical protein
MTPNRSGLIKQGAEAAGLSRCRSWDIRAAGLFGRQPVVVLLVVFLRISPNDEDPFSLVGSPRKAMRFVLKIELGGVTGLVVPLIGRPRRSF